MCFITNSLTHHQNKHAFLDFDEQGTVLDEYQTAVDGDVLHTEKLTFAVEQLMLMKICCKHTNGAVRSVAAEINRKCCRYRSFDINMIYLR